MSSPQEDHRNTTPNGPSSISSSSNAQPSRARSIFSVPPAVKRLFDRFPLQTYPAAPLPARSPKKRSQHVLYIFTTEEGASSGLPSFNPGCLKWQTYLRFCGVEFELVVSNNHASPTGALPFLLPVSESKSQSDRTLPIASNKLQRWADDHSPAGAAPLPPTSTRQEAYLSLLNHTIRRAWVRYT
jgi:metaxin